MKRRAVRKLTVVRQTLRRLDAGLAGVRGGLALTDSCHSCAPSCVKTACDCGVPITTGCPKTEDVTTKCYKGR